MEDFELPLSSPFTWKPSKICKFWNNLHNHIKPKFANREKVIDSQISRFCKHMEDEAKRCEVLGPTRNWRDTLGYLHFDLVTRGEIKVQYWWQISLTSLLKVIRNKHEHQDDINDCEKAELGWFQMVNGKLMFDDSLFAGFWTSRFPKLLPFLWNQLRSLSSNFREFYPVSLESMNSLDIDVEAFAEHLGIACSNQLDNDYLHERFICEQSSCSIELRMLPNELLAQVLEGNSIVKLIVSETNLTIIWNEKLKKFMKYSPESAESRRKHFWCSSDIGIFIFSSGSDIDLGIIQCKCSTNKSLKSRTVIFTTKDIIKSAVENIDGYSDFQKVPICWWDLSVEKRRKIKFGNEFLIEIQSNQFLFRDLLPADKTRRDKIMSQLYGNNLNELLEYRKICVLKEHNIPKSDQFYRERQCCIDCSKTNC